MVPLERYWDGDSQRLYEKSNHVTRAPLAAKNGISLKQYSSNGDVFIKTDAKNEIRNLFILEMARCQFLKIWFSDVIA